MKTLTIFRLMSSIIVSVLFLLPVSAQQIQASAPAEKTPVNNDLTAEELDAQIAQMTERAIKLRSRSRLAEGATKDIMLNEAKSLEKECQDKQKEYHQVNYKNHLQAYKSNHAQIVLLQKQIKNNENSMHTKYLLTEAEKNSKLAAELYEEASTLVTPANKIGSLDNADEKMSLSISQQEEAISLLKSSTKKATKNKS